MEQAYINEIGLSEFGIILIKGWREALLTPPSNKDYIQSESRLENGIRINTNNIKKKNREVSLQFYLEGTDEDDYVDKLDRFMSAISSSLVKFRVPKLKNRIYKFVYSECNSYGMYGVKKGKFVIKFIEPDPTDLQ